jgi:hypothetical protein
MQEPSAKTRDIKTIAVVGRWLQVSRYDRAASLLLALLCVAGLAATVLFAIWLTGKIVESPPRAVPPTLLPPLRYGENGGDGRTPGGSQLDMPSDEPVVGKDKETAGVKSDLSDSDVLAASKAIELDNPEATNPTRRGSRGTRGGIYGGPGDGRGTDVGPGPPGPRRNKDDRHRSWEVTFSSSTLDIYARQLDFFRIELAVLLPDNKIAYAFNLANPKPDTRVAAAAGEKRFYLTWRKGEMQKADLELLARAGIEVGDNLIVKFIPAETEALLADLERRYADQAGFALRDVRMTQFGIRPEGSSFEFFVLEQSYKR